MDDQLRYRQARERIAQLKGFYIHGLVFLLVIAGLIALNLTLGEPYWVFWVFLGWGAGVALHAALVFGGSSSFLSSWEQRKMRELTEQNERLGVGTDQTRKPAN